MLNFFKILYRLCFYSYVLDRCEFNNSSKDHTAKYFPYNYNLEYYVVPSPWHEWLIRATAIPGYVDYEMLMHSRHNRSDSGSILIKNDGFLNLRIYWFMLTKIHNESRKWKI